MTDMNKEIHQDRNDAGRGFPGSWLGGMIAVQPRSCYGVMLSGPTPVIVRSRRVSAVRVRHVVVSSADAALHAETQRKAAWQQWLADNARQDNVAVGCIPVQDSLTLWLQTPFASIPKAEKVLPALLDVQLPFPLESCHYRFVDIRRMPGGTTHALAVVVRLESLRARLAAYQAEQVNPVLLDHEGLALWTQSWEEYPLPASAGRLVFYVDTEHVTIVIGQGDRYQNAHSIQVRLSALTDGETDSRAALAGLIERCQRIVRAELPAEQEVHWLAAGIGAKHETLVAEWHKSLAAEWPGPLTIHREPETFLPRALGTRALTRGPLRCNLRVHTLTHPLLHRQIRRRAMTTAALLLAAGLLLCGLNLTWRLLTAQRVAGMKQAVTTLAKELAPGARIPYGQEVLEARKAMAQREERETPFLNAFKPSLAVRLADLIREGNIQGVAYETLTLKRQGFLLTGTSDDWDQCEQLALRLKALGYAVKLERQEAIADTQVRFSIKGEIISQKVPAQTVLEYGHK